MLNLLNGSARKPLQGLSIEDCLLRLGIDASFTSNLEWMWLIFFCKEIYIWHHASELAMGILLKRKYILNKINENVCEGSGYEGMTRPGLIMYFIIRAHDMGLGRERKKRGGRKYGKKRFDRSNWLLHYKGFSQRLVVIRVDECCATIIPLDWLASKPECAPFFSKMPGKKHSTIVRVGVPPPALRVRDHAITFSSESLLETSIKQVGPQVSAAAERERGGLGEGTNWKPETVRLLPERASCTFGHASGRTPLPRAHEYSCWRTGGKESASNHGFNRPEGINCFPEAGNPT